MVVFRPSRLHVTNGSHFSSSSLGSEFVRTIQGKAGGWITVQSAVVAGANANSRFWFKEDHPIMVHPHPRLAPRMTKVRMSHSWKHHTSRETLAETNDPAEGESEICNFNS